MKEEQEPYGFDPTAIVKIIVENRELGLALVQIPLAMLNNWIGGSTKLEWTNAPKFPGYYWVKDSNDMVTILYFGPEQILRVRNGSFAGPLIPPK